MTLAEAACEIEVEIETTGRHRTTIWIVSVGGHHFVRTYLGPSSRWYREVLEQPHCAIWAAGERIAVRASRVADPDLIDAVSDAFRDKYAGDVSMPAMVVPAVLGTTLELTTEP